MSASRRAKGRSSGAIIHAESGARLKVVVNATDIARRVRELARQITRDYAGKTLHVVGILEDSFVFMADLVRALKLPVVCYFVHSRVRDNDSGAVPMREIMYVPPMEVAGKDLLLAGGVLQSGVTLDYLCRTLLAQNPASLRTAILINKANDRRVNVPVDYAAFERSGAFLAGYGLAFEQQFRNLPFLAGVTK
jgi:hypoxanthine phosphoribosyltransferase